MVHLILNDQNNTQVVHYLSDITPLIQLKNARLEE